MKNLSHIFICGMPGSGKSSIVKPLAAQLNAWSFDLDQLIEEHHNVKVPDLIRAKGETIFRTIESQALQSFINHNINNNYVIALGGGTPCFNNNVELIKSNGLLIYVKTSIEVLIQRLSGNTQDRPLLQNGTALSERLQNIIKEREEFYLKADIIVDGSKNKEHTLQQIQASLKNLLTN